MESAVYIICIPCTIYKMNSTNWRAPNLWVFIAQLVEHCIANAEAIGWNANETPKFCFDLISNCLNCYYLNYCDDHIFIWLKISFYCCLLGCHVGTIITMPLSGLLTMYGFDGGWASVFYCFGESSIEKSQKISITTFYSVNLTFIRWD